MEKRDSKESSSMEEQELMKIYSILANPTKRKIILFLGERGKASATELRRHLKVSTGSLYYNLDDMLEYVTQDEDRRYYLTEKGYKLYNLILREYERFREFFTERSHVLGKIADLLEAVFIPYLQFKKLKEKGYLMLSLGTFLFILSFIGFIITGSDVTLLAISNSDIFNPFKQSLGPLSVAMKLIGSWILISMTLEILARILGSPKFDSDFVIATLISLSPTYLYPYAGILVNSLDLIPPYKTILSSIILRFLQIISLCFMTASLVIFKHIRKERAFILSSLIFYISLLLEIRPTLEL